MRIGSPRQLGSLLRSSREKAGLTQGALARQVGVSLRWLQRAEQGSPGSTVGKLLRALAAVGLEVEVRSPGKEARAPEVRVPDVNAIIERARGGGHRDRKDH